MVGPPVKGVWGWRRAAVVRIGRGRGSVVRVISPGVGIKPVVVRVSSVIIRICSAVVPAIVLETNKKIFRYVYHKTESGKIPNLVLKKFI